MSWIATTAISVHQLQTCLEQAFFGEGIADLNGRALFLGGIAEFGRGHGGAMNAVAPGLGAEINYRKADAFGLGVKNPIGPGEADRHGIDQNVAVIARVEIHLAADGRHAEGISIATDAGDDARYEMPGLRMIRGAEAQGIECRDGSRPHGEDIAQNTSNAGGGPLIGFDERRVVMAFHLENDRIAIAEIDHAGVFARSLDNAGAGGRQGLAAISWRICTSSARSTWRRKSQAR